MSEESLRTAGTLLVAFPTVVFGGASLLWHWTSKRSAHHEEALRRSLWRAGHAHAGVLLILSLIAVQLVDSADLAGGWKTVVRITFPGAAVLLPAAFFLSGARARAVRPTGVVNLAYVGGGCLVAGMLTLGVGLLRAT